MDFEELKSTDNKYITNTYARFDICLEKGKGATACDINGKEYLDFSSGIGVNSLGFANNEWLSAITAQAANLQHSSNLFYTQPQIQLAKQLCQRTGFENVFFANSGAEANEAAIKAARKYSSDKYSEERHVIISLVNSFHGRTMAALSATGQDSFHKNFAPFLPGFVYVEANNIDAFKTALNKNVCAVMLEPIQGEGGVYCLEKEYAKELEKICSENDILLIADEVQTGVGRCGTFLASEFLQIKPDIVTLAKGLGAGLPIGAALFGSKCANTLTKGMHGSTFGGNPVCCAGALVVLKQIDNSLLETITKNGEWLKAELEKLDNVQKVNGRGLMLGINFKEPLTAAEVQKAAMQNGLLCLTAKENLRLLPPLIITKDELQKGLDILKEIIQMFN